MSSTLNAATKLAQFHSSVRFYFWTQSTKGELNLRSDSWNFYAKLALVSTVDIRTASFQDELLLILNGVV